jgi:hypothetical protein
MKTTYDIVTELGVTKDYLYKLAEEAEGEVTEAVQHLLNMVDELKVEAATKVDAISWVWDQIQERESMIDGVLKHHEEKVALYKAKINAIKHNEERLKFKIMDLMIASGLDHVDLNHKNVKLLFSKSLVVEDQERAMQSIPDQYKRVKVEVDKTGLKKHIEDTGVSYEGIAIEEKPYLRGL